MFCNKCGQHLPETAQFCTKCGTKTLAMIPVAPVAPVVPVVPVVPAAPVVPGTASIAASPPPPLPNPPQIPQQESRKPKSGFGGFLWYPLLFLIVQPIMLLYSVLFKPKLQPPPGYYVIYHIDWTNLILDIIVVVLTLFLLVMFLRKKAILPSLFIVVIAFLFMLFALVSVILPPSGYGSDGPIRGFIVFFIQCFILIPYFVLSKQVKATFVVQSDKSSWIGKSLNPFYRLLDRFYAWLGKKRRLIFLRVFVFVVLVIAISAVFDMLIGLIY